MKTFRIEARAARLLAIHRLHAADARRQRLELARERRVERITYRNMLLLRDDGDV